MSQFADKTSAEPGPASPGSGSRGHRVSDAPPWPRGKEMWGEGRMCLHPRPSLPALLSLLFLAKWEIDTQLIPDVRKMHFSGIYDTNSRSFKTSVLFPLPPLGARELAAPNAPNTSPFALEEMLLEAEAACSVLSLRKRGTELQTARRRPGLTQAAGAKQIRAVCADFLGQLWLYPFSVVITRLEARRACARPARLQRGGRTLCREFGQGTVAVRFSWCACVRLRV